MLNSMRIVLLFLSAPWEPKELQVHSLDEVKVSEIRLVINFFGVVFVNDFKRFTVSAEADIITIRKIMSAQKAILFSAQPTLLKRKVTNVAFLMIYLQGNVIATEHVLPQVNTLLPENC